VVIQIFLWICDFFHHLEIADSLSPSYLTDVVTVLGGNLGLLLVIVSLLMLVNKRDCAFTCVCIVCCLSVR